MKTVITLTVTILWHIAGFRAEAGEPKLSVVKNDFNPTKFVGGMEVAMVPKLNLANPVSAKPDPPNVLPKLEMGFVKTTPKQSPVVATNERIVLTERLTETYSRRLYYRHDEVQLGSSSQEGFDSFGATWKLSSKINLILPYFRWDYPSRNDERILIGGLLSRSF